MKETVRFGKMFMKIESKIFFKSLEKMRA